MELISIGFVGFLIFVLFSVVASLVADGLRKFCNVGFIISILVLFLLLILQCVPWLCKELSYVGRCNW